MKLVVVGRQNVLYKAVQQVAEKAELDLKESQIWEIFTLKWQFKVQEKNDIKCIKKEYA